MEDIAKFFIGLFKDLRPPLRWLAAVASVFVLVIGLFAYEQITQNVYLTKLEKKVAILKELQVISDRGIQNDPDLHPIYLEIVRELNPGKTSGTKPSIAEDLSRIDRVRMGKAASGAMLWVILLFLVVGYQLRQDGRFNSLSLLLALFFLIAAAIFAWVGSIIPTIYTPWVNYILFPLLQLAGVLWIVRK